MKISQLNDSKLIGMSVYGIVVLSLALAAMGILLETFVEVYYAVMGIMIMLGMTCLLCLIFIPKVWCVCFGLLKRAAGKVPCIIHFPFFVCLFFVFVLHIKQEGKGSENGKITGNTYHVNVVRWTRSEPRKDLVQLK